MEAKSDKVTKYYISNWEKVKSIEAHTETKSVSILCEEIDSFFDHPLFDTEIEAVTFFVKWMRDYYKRDNAEIKKAEENLAEAKSKLFRDLKKLTAHEEILKKMLVTK